MSAVPVVHDPVASPLKFWGTRILSVLLAVGVAFGFQLFSGQINDYLARLMFLAAIYVTLAVSLNMINGITGQFSLGHAAFYMVGAYSAAVMAPLYDKLPFDTSIYLLVICLAGGAVAGLAGLLVGLPSLRLRGDYLAIVTLGFGEIVRIIANNQVALGQSRGMNFSPKISLIWPAVLLAIVCIALCRNLLKTAHGLPFLSVREDEIAASAMGVKVTATKVVAFVLGAALAGMAGVLFAHNEGFINPEMFKMEVSFLVLTMVVVGGTGSITGSAVAAVALYLVMEVPRVLEFNGSKIQVTLGALLACFLVVGLLVAAVRKTQSSYHPAEPWRKGARYALLTVGAIVLAVLMNYASRYVPALNVKSWPIDQLRMVILSVALLVVMLIKPTGVFGHHEFSWDWLKSVFGVKRKVEA